MIITTSLHDQSFPNRSVADLPKASQSIYFPQENIFDCLAFTLFCAHHSTHK